MTSRTVTMSRDLAERLLSDACNENWSELNLLLATAPEAPRQDNSALMKIAADLANRTPLRQLYLVCDTQSRIGVESLHEYLDKCGDLLAGTALDIRRAITSQAAPLSPDHSGAGAGVVLPEGWKAVPIEPTELMIRRGDQNYSWSVAKIYKAMIEDAPSLDKVKELNQ